MQVCVVLVRCIQLYIFVSNSNDPTSTAQSTNRVYHLKCLNLSEIPEGDFSCRWHNCDTCNKFTYEHFEKVVLCCRACPTNYCFKGSCVPSSVLQRIKDPNLAHFAHKGEQKVLEERQKQGQGGTQPSAHPKSLMKEDYKTLGGYWCVISED